MKTFSKVPDSREVLETCSCPVCGDSQVSSGLDCGAFKFARCVTCGHLYQNPRPRATDLINRYDEEYKDYEVENSANFLDLMLKGLRDVKIAEVELELVADLAAGTADAAIDGDEGFSRHRKPRFLDIGCATGALVEHFQVRGWEATGLEVCRPAAEYGIRNRGVRILVKDLQSAAFEEDHFDLIHSSHVLEHIPEPVDFLSEQFRVLRPGGYLAVTTPNTSSLQFRLFGARWRSAIADHVHLFSRPRLRNILRDIGFEVIRGKTWGGLAAGAAPAPLKPVADRLAKAFGFGDVMIFLVRKPSRRHA